jgi:hypothetical protein
MGLIKSELSLRYEKLDPRLRGDDGNSKAVTLRR